MRVLMVGTGSIGRRHMANLRTLVPAARFDLLREGRGAPPADGVGDTVSASLEEALSKAPDLMVIATPNALHLRYLLAAIDRQIPFYAEKPVVTTRGDVEALKGRMGGRLPPHIVGCNLRFLPSLLRLAALLHDGVAGRIVRARFEAGQWLPDWRPGRDYRAGYSASASLGGGVLADLVHEIDAALWLLGDFTEVKAITARASSLEIDCEDVACLLLGRAQGPIAAIEIDYVSRTPVRRYVVVGDQATLEWDLHARSLQVRRPESIDSLPLDDAAFDVAATYRSAMTELLSAIAEGRQTSQPLSEGLRSVEVMLGARAGAGR
jgi:predicted dehydrogenase